MHTYAKSLYAASYLRSNVFLNLKELLMYKPCRKQNADKNVTQWNGTENRMNYQTNLS